MPAIAKARKIPGNANIASTMRMMSTSRAPPQYPEIMPSATPTVAATPTTIIPTDNEALAPYNTRLRTHLPRWSVPNGYFSQGSVNLSPKVALVGLCGESCGAKMATKTSTIIIIAPTKAVLFCLNCEKK